MRAVVWEGIGQVVCREVPDPEPRRDEVLVRVRQCGLCGSDPHIIEGRLPVGPPPQVIGHEVAGEVAAVGAEVRGFEVGDRVACNLYGYCGKCPECLAGHPNHCRRLFFSAKGFAELARYRPEQLFRLPDEVGFEAGAMLEPLATALHAVERSRLRAGEHALVIGGGPLGLMIGLMARRAGAASVSVSEPVAAKRELAREIGFDNAVDPAADGLAELASEVSDREGFDVVFEVAGVPAALASAPALAARRGRIVVVAVFDPALEVGISPFLVYERELELIGTYAADRDFSRALALLGDLPLECLVTGREPLERFPEVYAALKRGEHVKVLFHP